MIPVCDYVCEFCPSLSVPHKRLLVRTFCVCVRKHACALKNTDTYAPPQTCAGVYNFVSARFSARRRKHARDYAHMCLLSPTYNSSARACVCANAMNIWTLHALRVRICTHTHMCVRTHAAQRRLRASLRVFCPSLSHMCLRMVACTHTYAFVTLQTCTCPHARAGASTIICLRASARGLACVCVFCFTHMCVRPWGENVSPHARVSHIRVTHVQKCVCTYTLLRRPARARVPLRARAGLRADTSACSFCTETYERLRAQTHVWAHVGKNLRTHASSVGLRVPWCATQSFHSRRGGPGVSHVWM